MSFHMKSVRPLTTSEIEQAQAATNLIRSGCDRRQAFKLVSLAGAFAASFVTLNSARAYIPAIIRVLSVPRVIALSSAVVASIEIWNQGHETLVGQLLLTHEEPNGARHKRASDYFELRPTFAHQFTDDGFIAAMIGSNRYIATSDIDDKFSLFNVINR